MDRDRFEDEIKLILEEEVKNVELSQQLKDTILKYRKKSLRERIHEFFNKEIEIPLIPVVAVFAFIFLITLIPKDLFNKENINVVDIGSSQIIIRNERRLSKND